LNIFPALSVTPEESTFCLMYSTTAIKNLMIATIKEPNAIDPK
jgi:hypothetical protein